jgi:hypothetical protein
MHCRYIALRTVIAISRTVLLSDACKAKDGPAGAQVTVDLSCIVDTTVVRLGSSEDAKSLAIRREMEVQTSKVQSNYAALEGGVIPAPENLNLVISDVAKSTKGRSTVDQEDEAAGLFGSTMGSKVSEVPHVC